MPHVIPIVHRHKSLAIQLTEDGGLELYLDDCLRKRRDWTGKEPQYVWTNVELEWEEHHYIEARFWRSTGALQVTVNGEPLLSQVVSQDLLQGSSA